MTLLHISLDNNYIIPYNSSVEIYHINLYQLFLLIDAIISEER